MRLAKIAQLSQSGGVPQGQLPCRVPRLCNEGSRGYIEAKERIAAMAAVRDNKVQRRFELDVEGQVAFANYRETPQAVIITHTETPRGLRGRGVASELVKGALELIRTDGQKVIAGCGFVVDYLDKHPEYRDLVA
jgi:predicted GNAT family acetyltransferase